MLNALKFVQGSIDRKGIVEELLHYRISGGRISGYNGRVSLSSPIDTDLELTPLGVPFMKAIAACTDTVALSVTAGGRVMVKSGAFRAYIQQTTNPFPEMLGDGKLIELPHGDFVGTLRHLIAFTAEDASRPWATGVLFKGSHAYATNNIVIVEHDVGVEFPGTVNIPKQTVREMIRLGVNPTHVQVGEKTITFLYEGERWCRTHLLSNDWPDVEKLLGGYDWQNVPALADEFFPTVEKLVPFAGDLERVYINNQRITTNPEDSDGATVDVGFYDKDSCFNINQLMKLSGVVHSFDATLYPRPCPFVGDELRGVIVGMVL